MTYIDKIVDYETKILKCEQLNEWELAQYYQECLDDLKAEYKIMAQRG